MLAKVSPLLHAQLAIPDARRCLLFAAPFLSVVALYWLFLHADKLIDQLFPHWEWERKLGWLNARANRRADAVMRWIGYAVYVLLGCALGGIFWGSSVFDDIAQQAPNRVADGMAKLSTLLVSFGIWFVYLRFELIPKLRNQHEWEELEKYRAEHSDRENDADRPGKPASPLNPSKIDIWSKAPYRSQQPGTRRY